MSCSKVVGTENYPKKLESHSERKERILRWEDDYAIPCDGKCIVGHCNHDLYIHCNIRLRVVVI